MKNQFFPKTSRKNTYFEQGVGSHCVPTLSCPKRIDRICPFGFPLLAVWLPQKVNLLFCFWVLFGQLSTSFKAPRLILHCFILLILVLFSFSGDELSCRGIGIRGFAKRSPTTCNSNCQTCLNGFRGKYLSYPENKWKLGVQCTASLMPRETPPPSPNHTTLGHGAFHSLLPFPQKKTAWLKKSKQRLATAPTTPYPVCFFTWHFNQLESVEKCRSISCSKRLKHHTLYQL